MANQRLPTADLFSLMGKTVIATGATGGLGTEMCRSLAEAGADIVSLQLPADKAAPALSKMVTETGRTFTSFECDVSDTKSVRAVFAKMWESNIVPDILLNCAGLNRRHPILEMTDADIDLVSVFRCGLMSRRLSTRILNDNVDRFLHSISKEYTSLLRSLEGG